MSPYRPTVVSVSEDLVLALVLAVPLAVAAIASFAARERVRWVVGIGIALAATLALLAFVAAGDNLDGEWDTPTRLFFGASIAGVFLVLWMIGVAGGWAAGRARGRTARQMQHGAPH